MKIVYYIGSLNRGGMENLLLDVCMRKTPYEKVCIYRHEGNMLDDFYKSGISLIQVPVSQGLIIHLWNLRRVILKEGDCIVHSQSVFNTMLLSFALLGTNIKIVTTLHGSMSADAPWWKRFIAYRRSEKIICVSHYQKHYFEKKWHLPTYNKLQVIHNGIDFTKIDSAKPSIVLGQSSAKVRLAMVGNFGSGRSHYVVVRGLYRIKERGMNNFEFYFIGRRNDNEAWLYDECVKYCNQHQMDNVHFLGGRNDVPSLLKSMDGFVYSTVNDTFGIAVVEAMAVGLPIVVNDWPVMQEVCFGIGINTNTTVRFFKTEDEMDCAQKIEELIGDLNKNRMQLQNDCLQKANLVKSKYSIQNHIENSYNLYKSILQS